MMNKNTSGLKYSLSAIRENGRGRSLHSISHTSFYNMIFISFWSCALTTKPHSLSAISLIEAY
jgi:hypothetical protein